jgi:NAD(P)-dependent dehydrogenase (short-subunit alcohol dehydrogenase family)
LSLTEKVVVTTGAGSGLGRSFSQALAADGACVVLFGRTRESLEETAAGCPDGSATVVVGDVTSAADVTRLFAETIARHSRIDVLLTCAGVNPQGPWLDISHAEWAEAMQVNVLAVERCCREAIPVMRRTGHGRIVNLGSRTASQAPAGWSAYATSKAALSALTRMLGLELADDSDILINDLIPGITKSKMSPSGQDPADVYPYLKQLLELPAGGPSGLAWFKGQPVNIWAPNPKSAPPSLLRKIRRRLLG